MFERSIRRVNSELFPVNIAEGKIERKFAAKKARENFFLHIFHIYCFQSKSTKAKIKKKKKKRKYPKYMYTL